MPTGDSWLASGGVDPCGADTTTPEGDSWLASDGVGAHCRGTSTPAKEVGTDTRSPVPGFLEVDLCGSVRLPAFACGYDRILLELGLRPRCATQQPLCYPTFWGLAPSFRGVRARGGTRVCGPQTGPSAAPYGVPREALLAVGEHGALAAPVRVACRCSGPH